MTGAWWACPACAERVWAIASEVGHRCPRNRRKWVAWVVVHTSPSG